MSVPVTNWTIGRSTSTLKKGATISRPLYTKRPAFVTCMKPGVAGVDNSDVWNLGFLGGSSDRKQRQRESVGIGSERAVR